MGSIVFQQGTPHINFVMGDKAQCFGDGQANSDSVANGQAFWLSQC